MRGRTLIWFPVGAIVTGAVLWASSVHAGPQISPHPEPRPYELHTAPSDVSTEPVRLECWPIGWDRQVCDEIQVAND